MNIKLLRFLHRLGLFRTYGSPCGGKELVCGNCILMGHCTAPYTLAQYRREGALNSTNHQPNFVKTLSP